MNRNSWNKIKTNSKKGFDKGWAQLDKLGAPVNKLTNKLGSEAFWPTTLDKECDKAARILRSFAKDGFVRQETVNTVTTTKQVVVQKIPTDVIRNARGLAIFTTMRTGLWVSGAGGSGVLIARDPVTNEWSPPSGILLHTAGLGFLIGVDIYDCVVVLNTQDAVDAFSSARFTLGGEMSAVAGPLGAGGILEGNLRPSQLKTRPVYSYLKSRGFYAGVQIDGTIIIERGDENEKFYGERLKVADILTGKARNVPKQEIRLLMNTVRLAEGRAVADEDLPKGDAPSTTLRLPDEMGDDPYGLKALESQGIVIQEAKPVASASQVAPATTFAPVAPAEKDDEIDLR